MAHLTVLAVALLAGVAVCNGSRIVGGFPTTIEHYPNIVQVEMQNVWSGTWSQGCAGNILNELYFVSAAHCFEGANYRPSLRRIRAGTTHRNQGGEIVYIVREHNHPSYRVAARFDGDITVVRLASFLVFTDVIRPVAIISPNVVLAENTPVIHAGWGATSQGGPASPILLETGIYIINHDLCRERYLTLPSPGIVTENMICAGLLDVGGRDACQGDSGGPLYYAVTGTLIGVVSWGHGCANATFPGISTAVSPYTIWITETAV